MRLKKFPAVLFVILILTSSSYASDVYNSAPTFSPYYAGSVRSDVLYDALRELNYIRWLIGVPSNVTLDDEYTRKAQHGAVLLDAIDTLSHTPGRPSDMDTSFYNLGYDAASHGNLAVSKMYDGSQITGNMTISYSTKMYMNDSDNSNISRLGHRRWLMNPRMTKTGFGISTRRGYAVTYVIEEFQHSGSGNTLTQEEYARYLEWLKWPISDEFITWPTSKHPHPLTYIDSETAWSVTLNRNVFDTCNASSISVRLVRVSDGRTWNFGASSSNGYYTIAPDSVAYDECIIFRPDGVSGYNSGDTWRVYISGLTRKDGGTGSISYAVTFTGEATGFEESRPAANTNGNGGGNNDGSGGGANTNGNGGSNNDGSGGGGCNSGSGLPLMLLAVVIPVLRRRKFNGALTALFLISATSASAFGDVYDLAPTFSPYRAGTLKQSVLHEALDELNLIRRIAGLLSNVTLNAEYTRRAQHGAVLLDAINTLTHRPGRPSGMTQDFYDLAYDGTTHGNISSGWKSVNGRKSGDMSLVKSLRECMDDSDSSNIYALGHRRWLMNPRLKQAGFGLSTRRGYAVTYVIEEFGNGSRMLNQREYQKYLDWKKWPVSDEFITWPSRKNPHPLEYFSPNTAWSVTLNSDIFNTCNDRNISVRLTRQNDGKTWDFSSSSRDGFFAVNHESYAYDECIIFRPDRVKYSDGETWNVKITGLTRKNGRQADISFTVRFTGGKPSAASGTRTVKKTDSKAMGEIDELADILKGRKSSRLLRVVL